MSTTTIRTCDYCGAAEIRGDRERWAVITVPGKEPRDICPVCLTKLTAPDWTNPVVSGTGQRLSQIRGSVPVGRTIPSGAA